MHRARSPQHFWRNHGRPRRIRPQRNLTHRVPLGTIENVSALMTKAAEAAHAAGVLRPLFPFEARDVAAIYTQKKGEGDGLWFALLDGRVFSASGEPEPPDPKLYGDAT